MCNRHEREKKNKNILFTFFFLPDLENLKIAHKKITVVAKKIDEAKHSFDCDLQMKKVRGRRRERGGLERGKGEERLNVWGWNILNFSLF